MTTSPRCFRPLFDYPTLTAQLYAPLPNDTPPQAPDITPVVAAETAAPPVVTNGQQWDRSIITNVLKAAQLNPDGSLGQVPYAKIVYRMLRSLYNRQTDEEQVIGGTKHDNGVGFNGVDAPFLTSVAQRAEPYGRLTPKQTACVAKSLVKYARQLEEISLENHNRAKAGVLA